MHRLMKSLMTQMQQMRTRDEAFQKTFLHHLTRKKQSANTAPSVTLDSLSRGGQGREGGGRGDGNYAAGQSRQDRRGHLGWI
eukprot:6209254-Pleurochrysis_carterae.AAC.3